MTESGQALCLPDAGPVFYHSGIAVPCRRENTPISPKTGGIRMSVDLKNSETLKNLMRAFAGESQARNRYTFAASVCRQQKLHVVEAVFRFTADQEKEHAEIFYNHMKELAGQTVAIDGTYPVDLTNDVKELLRKAQHNEYEEHDPVYKTFGDVAQQEGFSAVAASFHKIAEIERAHGNRFGRLADLLEQGKVDLIVTNFPNAHLNHSYIQKTVCNFTDVFIANPAYFNLKQQEIPFEELKQYPILMLDHKSTTSEFLHNLFLQHQLELIPEVELSSNDLLIDLARIGLGIAFIPDYCLSRESKDLYVVKTKEKLPSRQMVASINPTLPVSQSTEEFLKLLPEL